VAVFRIICELYAAKHGTSTAFEASRLSREIAARRAAKEEDEDK
jgi:hypothetical protein